MRVQRPNVRQKVWARDALALFNRSGKWIGNMRIQLRPKTRLQHHCGFGVRYGATSQTKIKCQGHIPGSLRCSIQQVGILAFPLCSGNDYDLNIAQLIPKNWFMEGSCLSP